MEQGKTYRGREILAVGPNNALNTAMCLDVLRTIGLSVDLTAYERWMTLNISWDTDAHDGATAPRNAIASGVVFALSDLLRVLLLPAFEHGWDEARHIALALYALFADPFALGVSNYIPPTPEGVSHRVARIALEGVDLVALRGLVMSLFDIANGEHLKGLVDYRAEFLARLEGFDESKP